MKWFWGLGLLGAGVFIGCLSPVRSQFVRVLTQAEPEATNTITATSVPMAPVENVAAMTSGTAGTKGATRGRAAARVALPWLHVSGTKIVTAQNKPVLLGGVNLGGWFVEEMWMMGWETQPPAGSSLGEVKDHVSLWRTVEKRLGTDEMRRVRTATRSAWMANADFAKIRQAGMNCVRLPFTYDLLNEPDGFATLDRALNMAKANGLYVILDLHGAPGRQSPNDHTGETGVNALFTNPAYAAQGALLWKKIAARYKNRPEVAGYDLLNEPMGAPDAKAVYAVQSRFIEAIRSVDTRHIVIVEDGYKGRNSFPVPAAVGWKNAVLSWHHYDFNAKSIQDQERGLRGVTASVRQVSQSHNAPIFIGEFQVEPKGAPELLESGIAEWQQAGASWTIWTYKTTMDGDGHGGMWGWVHADKPFDKLNPYTDSADTLIQKAAQFRTENLTENQAMTQAFRAAVSAKPAPPPREVAATAQTGKPMWKYTTNIPGSNWFAPGYKTAGWSVGAAGFGKYPAELPAFLARTSWTSHDIYLRRDFALPPGDYNNLQLTVSHDDDAEIYLNGVLAAHLPGFQHAYEFVPISPEALATLRPGKNLLAVHCHQDIRAQYVDVGIVGTVSGK